MEGRVARSWARAAARRRRGRAEEGGAQGAARVRVPTPEGSRAIVMTYCLIPKRGLTRVYIILDELIKIKISWAKPLIRRAIGPPPAIGDAGHNSAIANPPIIPKISLSPIFLHTFSSPGDIYP